MSCFFCMSDRLNNAAGYFCSSVARRLGSEVIHPGVYDDHAADYLFHRKAVGQECGKGVAVVPEERGHIPGVVGVLASARVIMR